MPKIVFATMTESGNDFEKHLHTFEEMKKYNQQLALVYRTKFTHPDKKYEGHLLNEENLKKIERLGINHHPQLPDSYGVGNAIKDAIRYAYELVDDNGAIIYLEPDKFDIVKDAEEMAYPVLSGNASLSIIGRTQRSMNTYPRFQKLEEEKLVNAPWSIALEKKVDVFFSPQVYSKKIAPLFFNWLGFDWGVHFAPLLELNPERLDNSIVLDSYSFPKKDYDKENGNSKIQIYRLATIRQCVISPFKTIPHLQNIAEKVEQIVNDLEDKIKSAGLTEQDFSRMENITFNSFSHT